MSGDKNTKNESTPKALSRDEIRAAIFSSKPKSEEITFFGVKIELRQPDLGVILDQRQQDVKDASFMMLQNYTFVPGTNERVFEEADIDSIRALPFGADMQRLTVAVNKLLGLDLGGLNDAVQDAMKSVGAGSTAPADNDAVPGAGEE